LLLHYASNVFLLVVNYDPPDFHCYEDIKIFQGHDDDLFGITWRHRSRNHRTRRGRFPIGGQWWPWVYLARLQSDLKGFGVTTLTFWGHVTLLVTWPLDSAYAISYWWSTV